MTQYFFDTIKKTFITVAKQFSNVTVYRLADDGSKSKTIKVELIAANKDKFYRRVNQASSRQGIVLPAMSIWNESIDYIVARQTNPVFGNYRISKSDNEIYQYMRNASPVDFNFTLMIKTKYYSDMRQILESIIPQFQPKKTVTINLIPEMDLPLDIPIVLQDVSLNFDTEMDEDAESVRVLDAELTFRAESWIFPPIEERHVAKYLTVNNGTFGTTYTDDESPDSIVNRNLVTRTDTSKALIKEHALTVQPSTVYKIDATDVIASAGEFFTVEDDSGQLPFVFEYDNGECYGKDWMIPETLTINKTGYIFVRGSHTTDLENTPEMYSVKFYTSQLRNHQIAENVLYQYGDFNYNVLSNLHIEKFQHVDKVYVNNGSLFIKSIGTDVTNVSKVYPDFSLAEYNQIDICIDPYTNEDDKIICGMSDEQGKYCYIKTTDDDLDIEICEWDGTETVIDTITLASQLSRVTFTQDGVSLNSGSAVSLSNEYIIPWMGNNFSSAFSYDCFLGF